MREKFVLLDEEKVITGSYRYAWTLVFSRALALAPQSLKVPVDGRGRVGPMHVGAGAPWHQSWLCA